MASTAESMVPKAVITTSTVEGDAARTSFE
jgi:hypothetical protein